MGSSSITSAEFGLGLIATIAAPAHTPFDWQVRVGDRTMATRRCAVCFLAVGALFAWRPTYSQGKAVASEALEAALEAYVKTWNRHNVNAWAATLTEDIWYTEATDYYQRMKGKKAVIAFSGDLVKTSDLKWEIVSIKMMPDGTATVVLRHHALILPKKGDKYASAFESTPTLARWRIEGGEWKMFYFTSDKGTALSEMKKDGVS
jgi:ketosteroid isomerase-like protein